MAVAEAETLIARNPANGRELARIAATDPAELPSIVARARSAQRVWELVSWPDRRAAHRRLWGILSKEADAWADLLRDEIGKPRPEALSEVVSTLDAFRWTDRHAGDFLKSKAIGRSWQRFLLLPRARLHWRPVGVVGMIGTWNYPLLLNAPAIAQALAAGNAVVWKPSELAALCGERFQDAIDRAGFPLGLVSAIQGGSEVGRALVEAEIDKGLFTGGVENGRRVLASLASRGIPAVAELSGFDAAVILPDAPLESTLDALAWAAFVGAGQTCVAVKRVYVVDDARPWAEGLAERARRLRVGDPAGEVDLGPLISEAARERFRSTVRKAEAAGARLLSGDEEVSESGPFVRPTVLLSESPEPEAVLAGVFGPVVVVRGLASEEEAVSAVNASPFGLSASVWGRDRRRASALAGRLEVGMASVNDAVAPSAHAAAPFGGVKASGFGRTRGGLGLREFVRPQSLFDRPPGGFRPQLFPYSGRMASLMKTYRRLFHP